MLNPRRGGTNDPHGTHTVATASIDDVTVAGVSLDCLVDWRGTPCVHSSEAGCGFVTRVETIEVGVSGRLPSSG
jgi:hypothetical protein